MYGVQFKKSYKIESGNNRLITKKINQYYTTTLLPQDLAEGHHKICTKTFNQIYYFFLLV